MIQKTSAFAPLPAFAAAAALGEDGVGETSDFPSRPKKEGELDREGSEDSRHLTRRQYPNRFTPRWSVNRKEKVSLIDKVNFFFFSVCLSRKDNGTVRSVLPS